MTTMHFSRDFSPIRRNGSTASGEFVHRSTSKNPEGPDIWMVSEGLSEGFYCAQPVMGYPG